MQRGWVWLDFLQNGIIHKQLLAVKLMLIIRGAYDDETVPGSRPEYDGLKIAVSEPFQ